ncbi:hypothetical protein DFJ73DRAFT_863693 [Zopfochytrium polystomum]|nr:hypothetical protein DFJ73DRAFT_863693 [Zopfochytrium polystomum]
MSEAELNQYRFQLEQVVEALARDPENKELQKLEGDLNDLINLYSSLVPQSSVAASTLNAKKGGGKRQIRDDDELDEDRRDNRPDYAEHHQQPLIQDNLHDQSPNNGGGSEADAFGSSLKPPRWVKGQTVLAKYKDGKYYEATIDAVPAAVSASTAEPHYTVIFKGYTTKSRQPASAIRDFDPTLVAKPAAAVTGGAANKKQPTPKAFAMAFANGEDRRSKKLKRQTEYQEHVKALEAAHGKKQQSWQSFAKGGPGKKAVVKTVAPLKRTSIFATPDDVNAKVGVTGSGKPMTQFQQRGKHIYERTD